jgi:hypothetical protein
MTQQKSFASATQEELPRSIEVYEIGSRRLYVKTGARNFAISEADATLEELLGIARDIAARQGAQLAFSLEPIPI